MSHNGKRFTADEMTRAADVRAEMEPRPAPPAETRDPRLADPKPDWWPEWLLGRWV